MSRPELRPATAFFLEAEWPERLPSREIALFRARLSGLLTDMLGPKLVPEFELHAGFSGDGKPRALAGTTGIEHGTESEAGEGGDSVYPAMDPLFSFDRLILPVATLDRILDLVALVELQPLVFDTWNLRQIEPRPSAAVNFRGPPGTGKTMAAHAIAHRLGRKILSSRLSDLESKYHGEGPKNLIQLFRSAHEQDAVLFLDEAESLLSRRFATPEQAAESAINSMRTELFMALDSFTGLVIFASNLPRSYDIAVESRLFHVDFALPDRTARGQIWRIHLPAELPLDGDVSIEDLAAVDGISGRDIKQAVISAALSAARVGAPSIDQARLLTAITAQAASTENIGFSNPDANSHLVKAVVDERTGQVQTLEAGTDESTKPDGTLGEHGDEPAASIPVSIHANIFGGQVQASD